MRTGPFPVPDVWDIDALPVATDHQAHVEWWFFRFAVSLGFDAEPNGRYPTTGSRFVIPDLVLWHADEPVYLIECKHKGGAMHGLGQVTRYAEVIGDPHRVVVTCPGPFDPDEMRHAERFNVALLTYAELRDELAAFEFSESVA